MRSMSFKDGLFLAGLATAIAGLVLYSIPLGLVAGGVATMGLAVLWHRGG